jgi:4-hydroxybenzoyl-CoA thioesterase
MRSATRRIVIEFGDCDPAGIVYYPNYFRFFDQATTHLLEEALGMKKRDWIRTFGIAGIPAVQTSAKFHKPSRFGDEVTIESAVVELGRASLSVHHRLLLTGDVVAVEAEEVRVWAGRDPDDHDVLRARSLPQDVRAALAGRGPETRNP